MSKVVEEENISEPGEKWRIIKNVLVISVAFMVHFTAFGGSSNLQSSINSKGGLGTASLAAVYAGLVLSNLFLPVVMIKWIGCKWTMALSFVLYMPYIIVQVWPSFYTFIPAGLSVGLGGGPLWCSKSTYLTIVSEAYNKVTGVPSEAGVMRFFGVFFMIKELAHVWGNLISSLVLTSGNNTQAVTFLNASVIPEVCGANFLPKYHAKKALRDQPPEKIRLLFGIYFGCMCVAVLIVVLFVDSLKRYNKGRKGSGTGLTGFALLAITLKLVKEPYQLLVMVITIWVGLLQAFIGADYTSAWVSCVIGTGSVGFVMIGYGLANSISALITGYIVKLIGRWVVMVIAAVLQAAILVTLLVWRPHANQEPAIYAIAVLWGLCDGVWIVQINAFYGILFPGREEAAYSIFKLSEAMGRILSYIYSPYLRTSSKLIVLLVWLIIGMIGYLWVEYKLARSKSIQISKDKTEVVLEDKGHDNISFNKIE